jgi:hypothetical protein
MAYLIIIVVLALVIAPLFSILPSKSSRQMMVVRRAAMTRGIAVELTTIDDPNPNQEKYRSNTGRPLPTKLSVAAYKGVARKPSQYPIWSIARRINSESEDGGVCGFQSTTEMPIGSPLRQFLADTAKDLPSGVQQIAWDGRQLVVFWIESGILLDGEKIFTFLDEGLQWLALAPAEFLTNQQGEA